MAANVRLPEHEGTVPLIEDRLTARCADLFNVAYEVLLQLLHRYFAHTEESDAELRTLADVAVGLMIDVIGPLGRLVTLFQSGRAIPGERPVRASSCSTNRITCCRIAARPGR